MFFIKQSEATAARRTVYFSAPSGLTIAGGNAFVSKGGGTTGATAAGTLTEITNGGMTNGLFAYQFTTTEVNTLGPVAIAVNDGTTDVFLGVAQVVPWDPYDAVRLGLTAIPNANAGATGGLQAGIIRAATAQAGAASTITLDASASGTDDTYAGYRIRITSGTGAGQGNRLITDYVGATKIATIGPDWTTNPDNTSVFEIYPC